MKNHLTQLESACRNSLVWLIGICALWLVFGCESQTSGDTNSDGESILDGIEVVGEVAVSESVTEPDEGKRGGFLRMPTGNTWTLDPVVGFDSESRLLYSEIYNGLTTITDDDSASVQPDLAQGMEVMDGGRTYSFSLRPGLKFSDGSPLTASDVKWSWERALLPKLESERALEVLGGIVGASLISSGEGSELTGVEVIDERRLTVHLESPRPDFLDLIADPVASVLKRENVQQWKADWVKYWNVEPGYVHPRDEVLPVGTGPFRLVKFASYTGPCVLERNDNYHGRSAYLDGVEFVFPNQEGSFRQQSDALFENESLDIMSRSSAGTKGRYETFESAPITAFLVFNSNLEPYDDVEFRRALVSSIDFSTFDFEDITIPGQVIPASRIVPQSVVELGGPVKALGFDAKKFVGHLTDSRYDARQIRLNFHTFMKGLFEPEISQLEDQWREALGLRGVHYLAYDLNTYALMENEGSLEILGFMITLDYPDPYAVLRVFHDTFGVSNSSPEGQIIERMLDEAATEPDAVARLEKYAEVEQYILDEGIALPLYWSTEPNGFQLQTWVHDFKIPKYGGSWFKDVWFDDTAPKRELPLP